jgi:hypothetical protein
MTSYPSSRLQIEDPTLSPPLDGLVRFLQESVGPGVVRVLISEAREPLSRARSLRPFDGHYSYAVHSATI